MVKVVITFLLAVGILAGCGVKEEPVGEITEGTVVDKVEEGSRGLTHYIMVEKNGQILKFRVERTVYVTVTKGVIISGSYYSSGHLNDITFPKLNNKNVDKYNE